MEEGGEILNKEMRENKEMWSVIVDLIEKQ